MTTPTQSTWAAPGRREAIERSDSTPVQVLVPGVELRPLVGVHNGVRDFFTGLLTIGPGGSYPLYTRSVSEALILLEGDGAVDVEDRRYRLGPLDAIHVAASLPRRLVNLSTSRHALFHVALANGTPDQTWVNGRFNPDEQPAGTLGREGAERICRASSTARFDLAPGAIFQDLYNADLESRGICGGYGVFDPGARLPCHRHEFDESITIIRGTATCIVEGRTHVLWGNATALVPQGSCHYFINLTREPMAMIWVYAGGRPDRIVMDETFCHPDKATGNQG